VVVGSPQPSQAASPAPPTPVATCPPNTRLGGFIGLNSAFVLGNSSSSNNASSFAVDLTNGDVESTIAVNGGIRLSSFGVNQRAVCNATEAAGFGMIVGDSGSVDFTNGRLFCGNLLASANVTIVNLPSFGNGGRLVVGNVTQLSGVNFTLAAEELRNASAGLCGAASANGTNSTQAELDGFGGITLRATGVANESFVVRASDLSTAAGLRLVGFNRNTVQEVVINVVGNGTATFSNFFVDVGSVPLTSIVWNICEAPQVVIQGFQFPGILLAPNSSVTLQNGLVLGQVVAATLRGSGGGQINIPFCP
jgi:choice-of-anchor A domain-containing protein